MSTGVTVYNRMADLYANLPSNASLARYPNNTGGSYTVQLPENLHLTSEWEVGLAEMTFKQDWPTVIREDVWVRVDKAEDTKFRGEREIMQHWEKYRQSNLYATVLKPYMTTISFSVRFDQWYAKQSKRFQPESTHTPTWVDFEATVHGKENDTLSDIIKAINKQSEKWRPIIEKAFERACSLPWISVNYHQKEIGLTFEFGKDTGSELVPALHCESFTVSSGVAEIFKVFGLENGDKYQNQNKLTPNTHQFKFNTKGDPVKPFTEEEKSRIKAELPILFPEAFIREPEYILGTPLNGDLIAHFDSTEKFLSTYIQPLILKAVKEAGVLTPSVVIRSEPNKFNAELTTTQLLISYESYFPIRIELSHTLYNIMGIIPQQRQMCRYLFPKNSPKMNQFQKIEIDSGVSRIEQSLDRAMNSLWVYTNIIEPHIVGHSLAPLLRVVNVATEIPRNETRVVTYTHPHYYPLLYHEIQEINISIYNIFGQVPVTFYDDVTVLLHFRKKFQWPIKGVQPSYSDDSKAKRQKLE